MAAFVDFLYYEKAWQASSISTVLGGVNTVLQLQEKAGIPYTDKLIKLQLKGLARRREPTAKGTAVTPS